MRVQRIILRHTLKETFLDTVLSKVLLYRLLGVFLTHA